MNYVRHEQWVGSGDRALANVVRAAIATESQLVSMREARPGLVHVRAWVPDGRKDEFAAACAQARASARQEPRKARKSKCDTCQRKKGGGA